MTFVYRVTPLMVMVGSGHYHRNQGHSLAVLLALLKDFF